MKCPKCHREDCETAAALWAECEESALPRRMQRAGDPNHFALYAEKLLIRGWAGTMSRPERAYVRAHRSEAQNRQAEAARPN